MSVIIVKVNFEAIINKYNQMIWCALPNLLNPLSERCTENPEIKKETISFETIIIFFTFLHFKYFFSY
jgi:hypothetical protein